jgi:hypothetical protein
VNNKQQTTNNKKIKLFTALALTLLSPTSVEGCSRVFQNVYNKTASGRSMDWGFSFQDVLFLNPPGQEMDGNAGDRSVTWTSKYVSIQCHTCVCVLLLQTSHSPANNILQYLRQQGSVTSSIIGFFSGMGDAAKEAGIPEGGCEGVSVVVSVMFLLFSHMCGTRKSLPCRFSPYTACIQ